MRTALKGHNIRRQENRCPNVNLPKPLPHCLLLAHSHHSHHSHSLLIPSCILSQIIEEKSSGRFFQQNTELSFPVRETCAYWRADQKDNVFSCGCSLGWGTEGFTHGVPWFSLHVDSSRGHWQCPPWHPVPPGSLHSPLDACSSLLSNGCVKQIFLC